MASVLGTLAVPAQAFFNARFVFQGLLRINATTYVPDGSYCMRFTLRRNAVTVWQQAVNGVAVSNGVFTAELSGAGSVGGTLAATHMDVSADTDSLNVNVEVLYSSAVCTGTYTDTFSNVPIYAAPTAMVADRCNNALSVANNTITDAMVQNTSITLSKLAASGAASGQVATWNGSAWAPGTVTNWAGSLAGDVTGTQGATSVDRIRGTGVSATAPSNGQVLQYNGTVWIPASLSSYTAGSGIDINGSNVISVMNATASNLTAGDFSAAITSGTYSINISGNAATATAATTAANFSGALAGDVTGNQGTTTVATVGGASAANVAAATTLSNAATNANTASAIVKRDASGNFAAGAITATGVSTTAAANNFDWSLSTGTFATGSGAVSLNGDTTLATAKTLSTTGTGALDFSGGSGVFRTTTGAVTIGNGAISVTGVTTINNKAPNTETATAGGANAYTSTVPITAYSAGQTITFKPNAANTAAATMNVNGLGAVAIQLRGVALAGGELSASVWYTLIHDGANFQILNSGSPIVSMQKITANGTYTPTTGTIYTIVQMVGNGGGAGGNTAVAGNAAAGGGAGGYLEAVCPASAFTGFGVVAVGATGTGGANTGATGTNGGSVTMTVSGGTLTATGGSGGVGATTASQIRLGGAGGTAPTATGACTAMLLLPGEPGTNSHSSTTAPLSGGGRGGSSRFGAGGKPSGGATAAGGAGQGYGAGGGGGQGATAQVGGAGSTGVVLVTEYRAY